MRNWQGGSGEYYRRAAFLTFCANVAASHPVAFVFGATSVHPDPANSGEPRVSLGELMENWVLDCILLIASMHARTVTLRWQ